MEKNEFFRKATLRICGNLEIENALHSLLLYLKDYMPVKRMYLQYFDETFESIRTIAFADEKGYEQLDQLTHLSKESVRLNKNVPVDKNAFLITNPERFPVSKEMMKYHNQRGSSVIILVLRLKNKIFGFLILQSDGEDIFTKEDLELVELLKDPLVIAMSNTLEHREVIKYKDLLLDDNKYLSGELKRLKGDEIVGANFGLKQVMHKVQQVAPLDSPVLLLGETGVGKDVIASAIHNLSVRSNEPFVSVNCGSIPSSLIDSELFGHEKGSFTGALSQKRGRFERADKGTIFLDEIGELPLEAQVKLLRVLQTKEIERIGGTKTIQLNIRIIAATNRNLEEMIKENQFREDLWFRLNVFPIWIPPLRERRSDIPALLQYFITQKVKELKLAFVPKLDTGVLKPLLDYSWPGNVRELQNIVERELILNPKGPLTFNDINLSLKKGISRDRETNFESDNLDEMNIYHIKRVLAKANGKIHGKEGAAELLGINSNTLRNKMNKLGISYKKK